MKNIKIEEQSMSDKTIKISFLGVDERSMSAYGFFFNSIKRIPCELVGDNSQSQICLIDKDAYNIQEKYEKFKQDYPGKYILLLSLKEHSCLDDKEFFLKKPVKTDALQASLKQIYHLLSGKPINTIPDNNTLGKTSALNGNIELTQESKINTPNDQPEDDTNSSVVPIKTSIKVPIKEKRKAVTAEAGKLLKIKNEKDFVGEQADIDVNDPEQFDKMFYEPDKFLQAIVEKICIKSRQTETIIQANIFNHVFYFDYQEQTIYSTVGPGIIRPLCLLPLDNFISYKVKEPAFRTVLHEIVQSNKIKKKQEIHSWNMESFMWLITLWCSRGRLPKDTSLTDPVYLMQWPNLTRLDLVPHAARISALLYKQPYTFSDIAQLLGIEQRYVFAFYSACKSIGLAHTSRREVDKTFSPDSPARHVNQSILSKLLGKLVYFQGKSKMIETA